MFDKEDRIYNKGITGCHKRCPCSVWVNCGVYIDRTEQLRRLKNKSDNTSKELHFWYDTCFRIVYEPVNSMGNG